MMEVGLYGVWCYLVGVIIGVWVGWCSRIDTEEENEDGF